MTLDFFAKVGLSRPLGLDDIELGIIDDHVLGATDDKTLVRVLIITLITRANVKVQKPQRVNKKSNDRHGEAQCQVCLP